MTGTRPEARAKPSPIAPPIFSWRYVMLRMPRSSQASTSAVGTLCPSTNSTRWRRRPSATMSITVRGASVMRLVPIIVRAGPLRRRCHNHVVVRSAITFAPTPGKRYCPSRPDSSPAHQPDQSHDAKTSSTVRRRENGLDEGLRRFARHEVPDAVEQAALIAGDKVPLLVLGSDRQIVPILRALKHDRWHA